MAERSELDVRLPVRGMLVGCIVILALLVLVTAATHFLPAGSYDRQTRFDESTGSTLEVVVPGSFRYLEPSPQGLLNFLFSPIKSLYYQGPLGAVIVIAAEGRIIDTVLFTLGELAGISCQTTVLAFQTGDGFSNLIWPTNPTLIVALALAVAVGWGPF